VKSSYFSKRTFQEHLASCLEIFRWVNAVMGPLRKHINSLWWNWICSCFFRQPSISARNCEKFQSTNEVVLVCSTHLSWVRLQALLFFLRESTNFSSISNCRSSELEPSQPGKLHESVSNTHRQLGNKELGRQEFCSWKTPGLWWVWLMAISSTQLLGYPSIQKVPSDAADHFSQDQSDSKTGSPSTALLACGQRCWLV